MLYVIDHRTGAALDAHVLGEGESLLLVQGMAGHRGLWGDPFVERLAREHEVIAYDHRGVAESSPADAPFTIADLADDALALLDAVGRESAHVVGISMGGMVAQEMALRAPDRIRSLLLGCTTAGGPDAFGAPGPGRLLEAMASGDRDRATRVAFEVNVSPGFAARPGELERFQTASLSRRVPVPVIRLQAAAAFGHDARDRLASVTVPTLVVHGELDEMILATEGSALAAAVPGARLASWPDAGHLFWWEKPVEAAALVLEHLGR